MPVSLRPPFSLSSVVRRIHASSRTRDLVAPPDPISHLRPVIYDDTPPPPPAILRHPYSLSEFTVKPQSRVGDYELQFKLQRQQLDALDQNFWLDSNTRFEVAKGAVLASLPPSHTPSDKECALSEFYKQWYLQESSYTSRYTNEWRMRNLSLIMLGARVKYQKFTTRLSDLVMFKSRSL